MALVDNLDITGMWIQHLRSTGRDPSHNFKASLSYYVHTQTEKMMNGIPLVIYVPNTAPPLDLLDISSASLHASPSLPPSPLRRWSTEATTTSSNASLPPTLPQRSPDVRRTTRRLPPRERYSTGNASLPPRLPLRSLLD